MAWRWYKRYHFLQHHGRLRGQLHALDQTCTELGACWIFLFLLRETEKTSTNVKTNSQTQIDSHRHPEMNGTSWPASVFWASANPAASLLRLPCSMSRALILALRSCVCQALRVTLLLAVLVCCVASWLSSCSGMHHLRLFVQPIYFASVQLGWSGLVETPQHKNSIPYAVTWRSDNETQV